MSLEQGSQGMSDSEVLAREVGAERDVYARYMTFALRRHARGEFGSREWVRNLGNFWEMERTARDLSRVQVAQSMDTTVASIEYLELGLLFDDEIAQLTNPDGFLQRYAASLNDPQLFERCRDQFSLPVPQHPPTA